MLFNYCNRSALSNAFTYPATQQVLYLILLVAGELIGLLLSLPGSRFVVIVDRRSLTHSLTQSAKNTHLEEHAVSIDL